MSFEERCPQCGALLFLGHLGSCSTLAPDKSDRERFAIPAAGECINMGHGHVNPNADGSKARCGGPGLCRECSAELGTLLKKEIAELRALANKALAAADFHLKRAELLSKELAVARAEIKEFIDAAADGRFSRRMRDE